MVHPILCMKSLAKRGSHARAALSSPSLPLGASVEIEGIFEIL